MNLQTIEIDEGTAKEEEVSGEKAFEKYFNDSDLFELFKLDDSDNCDTLNLIHKRDGFNYEKTPTNVKHTKFL